jgi:hypothetical protein
VNGAALVVAGIYFYRKLLEPTLSGAASQPSSIGGAAGQIIGVGPLASTGRFVVGFGFTFLVISLLEGASPQLAGNLALLVALGAVLGNGLKVTEDLKGQLNEKQQKLNKLGSLTVPNTPTVQVAAWEPMLTGPRTTKG